MIRDKEQARSYIVILNFNAVKDERARMDVTSTLGTGVASLVVAPTEVRYVLLDSKRFYFGSPQLDVMRPILAIPFDPRWLHNILFDMPIEGSDWSCQRGEADFLKECVNSKVNLKVSWSARSGERKTVFIEHPKAEVQINFQSFQPKVQDRKNLFVLEAPEGFQKLRVR